MVDHDLYADIPEDAKYLPRHEHFTELVIEEVHQRLVFHVP